MLKKHLYLLMFFVFVTNTNKLKAVDPFKNIIPYSAAAVLEEPHVPLNGIVSVISYLPKLRFLNINALPLGIFLLIKQIQYMHNVSSYSSLLNHLTLMYFAFIAGYTYHISDYEYNPAKGFGLGMNNVKNYLIFLLSKEITNSQFLQELLHRIENSKIGKYLLPGFNLTALLTTKEMPSPDNLLDATARRFCVVFFSLYELTERIKLNGEKFEDWAVKKLRLPRRMPDNLY